MSLTSLFCVFQRFLFLWRFLFLDFLYLLSSARSDSFFLLYSLHLMVLDEIYSLDDECDNDGSDSGSSGMCAFIFRFDDSVGRVSGVGSGVFFNNSLFQWWCCYIGCDHTNRSRVQSCSTHKNMFVPKVLICPPNVKISCIYIVLVWPCRTHSNRCRFAKNRIRSRPMGSICQPSNPGSGEYRGYQIHMMSLQPGDPNTRIVAPRFLQHYLQSPYNSTSRRWRWNRGRVHQQLSCWKWTYNTDHRSTFYQRKCPIFWHSWFFRGSVLFLIPNLHAPTEPTGCRHGGTSNQNWGVIQEVTYTNTSVAWGITNPARQAYMPKSPVNLRTAASRVHDDLLCRRCNKHIRSPTTSLNTSFNNRIHLHGDNREVPVT